MTQKLWPHNSFWQQGEISGFRKNSTECHGGGSLIEACPRTRLYHIIHEAICRKTSYKNLKEDNSKPLLKHFRKVMIPLKNNEPKRKSRSSQVLTSEPSKSSISSPNMIEVRGKQQPKTGKKSLLFLLRFPDPKCSLGKFCEKGKLFNIYPPFGSRGKGRGKRKMLYSHSHTE